MCGVSEDQWAIVQLVRQFATESLASPAAEWDETHSSQSRFSRGR